MPEEENVTPAGDAAATDEAAASAAVPDSLDEVADTTIDTVGGIWTSFVEHLPFLGVGLLILLATWGISFGVQHLGLRLMAGSRMRRSLQILVLRLIGIVIWIIGLLVAAVIMFPNLTPTKALGGLGLLSVAVGFAFRDIFENFFAGVLMLWRFPFEEGDFIECEGITGRVVEINIRMTTLRRVSGELVVLPNSFLFGNPVDVLTDRRKRRAIAMVGVGYDEDLGEAVEVVRRAVESCETVRKDEPIRILPQAFGDSSMDIEVEWWTDPEPVDLRVSRGEVVLAIKRALDEAGIEIPFPYRTLMFKEPLETVQMRETGPDGKRVPIDREMGFRARRESSEE